MLVFRVVLLVKVTVGVVVEVEILELVEAIIVEVDLVELVVVGVIIAEDILVKVELLESTEVLVVVVVVLVLLWFFDIEVVLSPCPFDVVEEKPGDEALKIVLLGTSPSFTLIKFSFLNKKLWCFPSI